MSKIKLIAHRGLINGPNKNAENTPNAIQIALNENFDVELDLWVIYGKYYLGHDEPQYQVDEKFLSHPGLWIHAKNLEALVQLANTDWNYFWHQEDDFTLTSKGFIWTYPEKPLSEKSIRVLPEQSDPEFLTVYAKQCYGICSKFVNKIKTMA